MVPNSLTFEKFNFRCSPRIRANSRELGRIRADSARVRQQFAANFLAITDGVRVDSAGVRRTMAESARTNSGGVRRELANCSPKILSAKKVLPPWRTFVRREQVFAANGKIVRQYFLESKFA